MANLLTPEQKNFNKRERTLRLIVVSIWFSCGVLVLATIFLLPSFILAESKESALEDQVDVTTQIIEKRKTGAAQEEVRITKAELGLLRNTLDNGSILDALSTILVTQNSTISISGIVYSQKGENIRSLDIEGVASDRLSLLEFKKRLERELTVLDVVLPVSDLAESVDISFNISLNVTKSIN